MSVPARFRIPRQAYPGFGRLVAMPPAQVEALVARLREVQPTVSHTRLSERLAPDLGIPAPDLGEVLGVVISLYLLRDELAISIPDFVAAIRRALEETRAPTLQPSDGDWDRLKERLALLLDLDASMGVIAKATQLRMEQEHTFLEARILSAIRPVFGVNPDDTPTKEPERQRAPLLISHLNWSLEEVLETRARLHAFEEDWEAPGMEAYDNL